MLAENGLLLLSAPLFRAPLEPPAQGSESDAEAPEELVEQLAGRFANVRGFRRRLAIAAVVAADDGAGRSEVEDASWLGGGRAEDRTLLVAASSSELPDFSARASMISFRDLRTQQDALAAWEERARRAEADGSAKHWELVAAREAQRRLRKRLHHLEHRPLRRLWPDPARQAGAARPGPADPPVGAQAAALGVAPLPRPGAYSRARALLSSRSCFVFR